MKIITNGNAKSGVSKTTTTCCLAFLLNLFYGNKVLVMDLDSQDQDRLFFKDLRDHRLKYSDIKSGEININKGKEVDLITVGYSLLNGSKMPDQLVLQFRNYLKNLSNYDMILIDTPSQFNYDSLLGYQLADFINIVTETSYASYSQIEDIMDSIQTIKDNTVFSPEVNSITISMKDHTKSDEDIAKKIESKYSNLVFNTIIKRRSKIREFFNLGISQHYADERKAMSKYRSLTVEFYKRYNLKNSNILKNLKDQPQDIDAYSTQKDSNSNDKVNPKNQKRALTTSSLNSRRIACTFTLEITLIEELRKLKQKYKINIAKFMNDSATKALKEQFGIDVHNEKVLVSNIRSYISKTFTSKLNYFFVEDIKGIKRDNLKIKTSIKPKQFSTHLKNIEKFYQDTIEQYSFDEDKYMSCRIDEYRYLQRYYEENIKDSLKRNKTLK